MGFLNIFGRKKDSNESKQNSKYDILEKYTKSWLRQASDEELETEREKVRLLNNGCEDMATANKIFYLLSDFDAEMSKRAWGDNPEYGYPAHREHGWTLPNDDK